MKRLYLCFALLCLATILYGCKSATAKTEGLTASELIQRGQEAYDWNNYKLAYQYYSAISSNYPQNIDLVCEAEYEVAHIHYKQRKYSLAREEMDALLDRYDEAGSELLPAKFKILAGIVLTAINEKEKKIIAED
jgi:outer membrane protein assembly factor BamD (BamD/ComL family)